MIVEPTHKALGTIQPAAREERSMLVLELSVAGICILVSLLLSLAR